MRAHCWHVIEAEPVRTSWPPQYRMVCCNCGIKEWKTADLKKRDEHGRFLPMGGTGIELPTKSEDSSCPA